MSRLTFLVAAYATLLLQTSLEPGWRLSSVTPSLLLILAVFIAQCGPGLAALGSALLLGLLADTLARPYHEAGVLIGPYTLGYTVGAYAVLQGRTLLFRHSVWTLLAMTFLAACFAELIATAVIALRGFGLLLADPAPDFRALNALGTGLLRACYSAAVAVPVGWLLLRTRAAWRFGHG